MLIFLDLVIRIAAVVLFMIYLVLQYKKKTNRKPFHANGFLFLLDEKPK